MRILAAGSNRPVAKRFLQLDYSTTRISGFPRLQNRIAPTLSRMSTAAMATAYQIRVPSRDTGLLKFNQSEETASKSSELLQKDLEVSFVDEAVLSLNPMLFQNHLTRFVCIDSSCLFQQRRISQPRKTLSVLSSSFPKALHISARPVIDPDARLDCSPHPVPLRHGSYPF